MLRFASLIILCGQFASPVFSDDSKPIRLVCEITNMYGVYNTNLTGPVSEQNMYAVFSEGRGVARISEDGFSKEYTGTISEEIIYGEWAAGDKNKVKYTIKINRYTGSITKTMGTIKDIGVIYTGSCKALDKPKF